MDLFTNIHKAAEIINKNKNTHIYIVGGEEAGLNDTLPVGVSKSEWEKCIARNIKAVLMAADDLETNFNCAFALADLRAKPEDGLVYENAMKVIIRGIWEKYIYAKDLEDSLSAAAVGSGVYVGSGSQTIQGVWNTTLQSGFSNLVVSGGLEVSGEINADDIKVNGGLLSVSGELDDLKKRNDALKAELDTLKAILASKGVV